MTEYFIPIFSNQNKSSLLSLPPQGVRGLVNWYNTYFAIRAAADGESEKFSALHKLLLHVSGSMKKNNYVFNSVYRINMSPEDLWQRVTDVESWPAIWKYFRYVSIVGDEKVLKQGSTVRCSVSAAMFYKLDFRVVVKEIIPGQRLRVLCTGDLEGEGLWTIEKDGEAVKSSFTWNVITDSLILRFFELLPLGRVFLQFNHNLVMKEGYRSFLRKWGLNPVI